MNLERWCFSFGSGWEKVAPEQVGLKSYNCWRRKATICTYYWRNLLRLSCTISIITYFYCCKFWLISSDVVALCMQNLSLVVQQNSTFIHNFLFGWFKLSLVSKHNFVTRFLTFKKYNKIGEGNLSSNDALKFWSPYPLWLSNDARHLYYPSHLHKNIITFSNNLIQHML